MGVRTEPISLGLEANDGVEFGSFAPTAPRVTNSRRLVIATYNIRYAAGARLISGGILRRVGLSWPARRPRLVGRNIKRAAKIFSSASLKPDVLALQEADRGTRRAGRTHVALELARLLRMSYAHASLCAPPGEEPKKKQWYLDFEEPLGPSDEGATGVALLSRVALEDIRRVELPWTDCPWRPRLALAATVPLAGARLRLFNLHIDPHGQIEDRIEQLRAVLAEAEKGGAQTPVVLLGDFNTLSRNACVAVRDFLESAGFSTPMPTGTPTWRAGLLRLHADWIFVRGARVLHWGVARARGVSDHWPVWAEVEADVEG